MTDPVAERIQSHPKYLDKPFLAQPIGNGVTTLGVPLGFGVIVFTIVITGIYVRRANGRYDALTQAILKDAAR